MKKLIITTLILLIAAIAITVVYFKNLNTTASQSTKVMQTIPNTAALVFEFSNDGGFYDIFDNNELLTDVAGKQKIAELAALRQQLLLAPLLKNFFEGQHIYLSIHAQPRDSIDFLITIAGNQKFSIGHLNELAKQAKTGMAISTIKLGGKDAYSIFLSDIKKRFYLADKGNHVFSGSFCKELAEQSAQYEPKKDNGDFLQIPDQQNSSSLANLYVNYSQLTPLLDQFFKTPNNSFLKTLRMMPALGALTMNYKDDALMFNGYTMIPHDKPLSYLAIFRQQLPIPAHLKDLFPSTTAFSNSFALSDTKKFSVGLGQLQSSLGLTAEKNSLFSKVKSEAGIALPNDFNNLLSGEFAVLYTRFDEKLAIIALKDGPQARPLMVNISTMNTDDIGQFKYNKLPFYLLGDTFSVFNHPYFMIIDNYLVLANSINELASYKDSYQNHKFLNKIPEYTDFDNRLAERYNAAFSVHFKNTYALLKRDLKPSFSAAFNPDTAGGNKFYALSWQFSAADDNFYTNFYMRLSNDVTLLSNN